MTSHIYAVAAAAALALAAPAVAAVDAGTGTAAAPATTSAPARARKSENVDDPSKFFWFHKEGIDSATAKTDIEYCLAQTGTIRAKRNPSSGQGGLIGALVEGIVHSIIENVESRRMRDAGMRKCMGLYGYSRFHVPEPQWNGMMRATDAVDQLTAYASGPVPSTERLAR